MRPSTVKQRWAAGKPAFCTEILLTDERVTELASMMGFDCLWIDLEHACTSVETLSRLIARSRLGAADIMARPARGEFMRLGRLLESGANGILYPRCESAEEAREVVRWAKFAPMGERGYAGGNADGSFMSHSPADYVEWANRETWIFIQIESPAALGKVDEIAAVEGIDGLFFGPGDFSHLLGRAGQLRHPEVIQAMETTCRAALRSGKQFGTLGLTDDHTRHVLDMGGSFVAFGTDLYLLKAAFADIQRRLGPLGFEFPNKLAANSNGQSYPTDPTPKTSARIAERVQQS